MPQYEFECQDCKQCHTQLLKVDETPELCPSCGSGELQRTFSLPSNLYHIKGNNSASTRPNKGKANK